MQKHWLLSLRKTALPLNLNKLNDKLQKENDCRKAVIFLRISSKRVHHVCVEILFWHKYARSSEGVQVVTRIKVALANEREIKLTSIFLPNLFSRKVLHFFP